MVEEERTKAAGRARVAKDAIDMTDVNLKESEQNALADQALADFAAREGLALESTQADAGRAARHGCASEPPLPRAAGEELMPLSPEAPAWAAEIALAYESTAQGQFILSGNVHDRLPVNGALVNLGRLSSRRSCWPASR